MTQVVVPGFILNNGSFVSTVDATFYVSDGATVSYTFGTLVNDFGTREVVITPTASISLDIPGEDVFFLNLSFSTGATVPVISVYDDATGLDYVFFLDNTVATPTNATEFNTLNALITGASEITSGPYAQGAAIDLTMIATATTSDMDVFDGTDGDDVFYGGAGNDILAGMAGNDTLNGGAGTDILRGGSGDDDLNGGAEYDLVDYSGAAGGVTADLNAGSATDGSGDTDTLTNIEAIAGSAFADTLSGDGNDNAFNGSAGDDILTGRGGHDFLLGGAGADILNGNSGRDTADYSGSADAVTVDLRTGTGTGGDADGDTLMNIEILRGSVKRDTLLGYTGDDELYGNDGADTLKGKAGDDYIEGGGGADTLNGGGGEDEIYGGNGADRVLGRGNDDRLFGGDGDDVLKGHGGNDTLDGGADDDHIEGKGGDDTLTGGTGADTFVFEKNRFGNDVITDFEDDVDTIELVQSLWGGGLTAAQVLATYATQDGADVDFDFGTATLTVQNTTVAVLENDLSFV